MASPVSLMEVAKHTPYNQLPILGICSATCNNIKQRPCQLIKKPKKQK